jgi:hypothetical protein
MPDRRTAGELMAYAPPSQAAEAQPSASSKVRYIPKAVARSEPAAAPKQARQPATVAATVKVGERINDPWMRAMMVAPNAHEFMSTSLYGAPDLSAVREHMQKPAATVMMTFSADPHLGMMTEEFRGNAVVFVATVTFRQRTAALQ